MTLRVTWYDHGVAPKCPPNPEYPDGIDIDMSQGARVTCYVELPYPAKRCGMFSISCDTCKITTGVTTAGRRDDPRSIKLPCRKKR